MGVYKIRGRYIFFIDVKNRYGKFYCERYIKDSDVVTGTKVGHESFGDVYLMKLLKRRNVSLVCICVNDDLNDKGYNIEKYQNKYL